VTYGKYAQQWCFVGLCKFETHHIRICYLPLLVQLCFTYAKKDDASPVTALETDNLLLLSNLEALFSLKFSFRTEKQH
jgi:hypothetical protein